MSIRIAVMSDLHIERYRHTTRLYTPLPEGHPRIGPRLDHLVGQIDILALAGDIDHGALAIGYADDVSRYLGVPVVTVAGNHEFYGTHHDRMLDTMRNDAARTDGRVSFLENSRASFEFDGRPVHVFGCTLWTDFALFGVEHRLNSFAAAALEITDYRVIKRPDGRSMEPADTMALHEESIDWLGRELQGVKDTAVVLVHHGVSPLSGSALYMADPTTPAFLSDLEPFLETHQPSLVVHGHTHFDVDFAVAGTRVIAHQQGYVGEYKGVFRPLVIEI